MRRQMNPDDVAVLCVQLPSEMKQAVEHIALEQHTSTSHVVRAIIRGYLQHRAQSAERRRSLQPLKEARA